MLNRFILIVGVVLNLFVVSHAFAGGAGRLAIGAGKQAMLDALAKRNHQGMFGLDEVGSIEFTRIILKTVSSKTNVAVEATATEGQTGNTGQRLLCYLNADIEYDSTFSSAKAINIKPAHGKFCNYE